MPEPVYIIDSNQNVAIAKVCSYFPLLFIMLMFAKKIVFWICESEKVNRLIPLLKIKKARKVILNLFMVLTVVVWIIYSIQILPDFIPTKWSDFGFWSEKYDNIKENILNIKSRSPLYNYIDLRNHLYICVFSGALISIGELVYYLFLKNKKQHI